MEKRKKPTLQSELLNGGDYGRDKDISSLKRAVACLVKNLDNQVKEQARRLGEMEKRLERADENLRFLTRKLVEAGYIRAGERRKILKRNALTQEALIGLLDKNKIISKKALVGEIRRIGRLPQRRDAGGTKGS